MGVISTGSIFKTLTFDGKSSAEFNVYITGEGVFNAPERAVEMISIPGRNGAFALDNGRFENIEVTYNCGIAGDSDTDFAEAVSTFRNWLCSRKGYVRLTDDYNANEYRMAIYKSGLEVAATQLIAGEFPIVFECKPQRFLTSGEDKITVGEWGETTTETGDIVEIENPDGILSVKSLMADIEPIQEGTGDPSTTNIRPITGWTDCEVTQTGFNQFDEGTTYSTALGSTVYGGTLDIVSGELTITHAGKTYNGTESWLASTQTNPAYFVLWDQDPSKSNTDTTQKANWLIGGGNSYQTFGYYRAQVNGGVCVGNRIGTTDYKWADATEFKAYLAGNPLQIVYELATPTTTTLTAQQVELLLGENNIWADTGNVAVEFGQNPNILVNPTLFESRPMLEVTGSGNLNIGSNTIQINNEPIGDVVVFPASIKNTAAAWAIPFETQFADNGDYIRVSYAEYSVNWTIASGTINSWTLSTTGQGDGGAVVSGNKFTPIIMDRAVFEYGTSATSTTTGTFDIVTSNYGTLTAVVAVTLSYNGTDTITFSHSATRPTQFSSANPKKSISDIILESSQTTLGNPIYLDLNIGEAYKIENDVPVSANNGVVIPAELPTLTPGANTITYDNTITQLDIMPRWWKI